MLPRISIITPTLNRASFLKRMIKSVLEQNSQNWELIIIDDGSTDNTKEVVEAFNDSRIKYLDLNISNVGDKRNEGIRRANSKYITFLDSDDEAMPNWIYNFQKKIIENYKFISCGHERIKKNNSKVKNFPQKIGNINIQTSYVSGTLCIHKQILQGINGFDAQLASGLNTDLNLKLLPFISRHNLSTVQINECLIRVYEHSGKRIRNDSQAVLSGTLVLLQKHINWFEKNPGEYKNYLGVIGVCFAKQKNYRKASEYLFKSFKIKPGWKSGLRLILIFIPFLRKKMWKEDDKFE